MIDTRNIDEHTITRAVLASFEGCRDARLRTLLTGLVQHLHAFAREVKLGDDEWWQAIRFLTDAGHITDDRRQEFILLSDVLGLSTLVMAQNNAKPAGCTEATVFGPFYVEGAPEVEHGADIRLGAPGEPCYVSGRITDLDGAPVPGAIIDVWQSDEKGLYDVQYTDLASHRARARLRSRGDGTFDFRSIVAVPYPIPHDGPVGKLLRAAGRHPWRPAHLHFMIQAPGYERLITHVFRRNDRYLDSDPVFGVRSTLIADWVLHAAGPTPDGKTSDKPFFVLQHDFVLNRADREVTR